MLMKKIKIEVFLFVSFSTKKTKLAPLSEGMENWLNPPVKTLRDYRLFDITNYMDIMTETTSPKLEFKETLPLTYRYKKENFLFKINSNLTLFVLSKNVGEKE